MNRHLGAHDGRYLFSIPLFFLAAVLLFQGQALIAQTVSVPVAVAPENPRPGEPVAVGFSGETPPTEAVLISGGRPLARAAFFTVPGEAEQPPFAAAVMTVPITATLGAAAVVFETPDGAVEIPIYIIERKFESEEIYLNESLTELRSVPDPRKTAESEQLWAILNKTGTETHGFGPFVPPVTSTRRTSQFGMSRIFRYSNGTNAASVHAGVDYGVPKGTPVTACGPGNIVLARSRIVTGNTVIIEHLPGVYSLYYHLDSVTAAEGSVIGAGTLLGYSGSTGLATGPHLHWEIRISGENTDPDSCMTRPIIDKKAILSRINQTGKKYFSVHKSDPGEGR